MARKKIYEDLQERMNKLEDSALAEESAEAESNSYQTGQLTEDAVVASKKPLVSSEKKSGAGALKPNGPVGLDVGTSHIVVAQNKRNFVNTVQELNAFFTVPNAKFAGDVLNQKDVRYYERGGQYYIFGFAAQSFANMFSMNTKRPMQEGFLSPTEDEGLSVIEANVNSLIQKPKISGEVLCFSIPGEPFAGNGNGNGNGSLVYHESIISRFLSRLGYTPISVNEGMATVLSELADEDFSGIGISMGGGMCNVCLSYLSFPVITFSIQTAGDYIDFMVGKAVGEPASKIKTIKEESLILSKNPTDRITTALHIFYDEVIFKLLESLQRVITSTEKIPKISNPIPLVLSGGTAMPHGCKERFDKMLKTINLPFEISNVQLAKDPLNTTAKGALIMALTEAG